jgi:hypothetical protein
VRQDVICCAGLSIRTGAELSGVRLTVRKVSRAAAGDVTAGQPELWTFIEFEADESQGGVLAEALADVLERNGGWYADFRTPDETFVVYSGRGLRALGRGSGGTARLAGVTARR